MARKPVDDGLPDPELPKGEGLIELPPQPKVDPWEVMDRLTRAMERMSERRAEGGGDADRLEQLMVTMTGALARLAEAQVESGKLIASETRRAHRPSNEVVPGISVFNRRGTNLKPEQEYGTMSDGRAFPVKAKLKCVMLIPWLVEWESCTREEVDLLNLLESGDYTILRTDRSKVRISVTVEYKSDGRTPSRLVATHDTAFNNDNKNLIPPTSEYLRQMLRQHPLEIAQLAAAVMTDEEEEALIEAGEIPVSA